MHKNPIGSFSSLIHWHAERDRVCVAQAFLPKEQRNQGRVIRSALGSGKKPSFVLPWGRIAELQSSRISLEVASDRNLPIASVNAQCRADS